MTEFPAKPARKTARILAETWSGSIFGLWRDWYGLKMQQRGLKGKIDQTENKYK